MPYINVKEEYFPWYCVDCPFFDIEFETYRSFETIEKVFFDCEHRNICYRLYTKIRQELKNNADPDKIEKEAIFLRKSISEEYLDF